MKQIVIDIPEAIYNTAKHTNILEANADALAECIRNGTVLPEHYGRLLILDEEKVEQELTPLSFSSQRWISEVGLFNSTVAILEAKEQEK